MKQFHYLNGSYIVGCEFQLYAVFEQNRQQATAHNAASTRLIIAHNSFQFHNMLRKHGGTDPLAQPRSMSCRSALTRTK